MQKCFLDSELAPVLLEIHFHWDSDFGNECKRRKDLCTVKPLYIDKLYYIYAFTGISIDKVYVDSIKFSKKCFFMYTKYSFPNLKDFRFFENNIYSLVTHLHWHAQKKHVCTCILKYLLQKFNFSYLPKITCEYYFETRTYM